ncbi:MAG: CHAT domain-containing protein, partial [Phycisphaerae bacterium]|nr:CHAT domain-containing protein [Saprospiraceae bacterium]
IANCYAAMGECYLKKKALVQSDSFIRLALQLLDAPVKKNVAELSLSMRQLALCRMYQGRFAEADSLLGRIFTVLEVNAADTVHWGKVRAPLQLANTLIARARLHYQWALAEGGSQGHQAALYWGETALSYISNWESKLATSSSRRETRSVAREAREICAAAAFHLKVLDPNNREKWLQQAFGHIESAHNSQLRDALLESRNRQVPNKPDASTLLEDSLRLNIAHIEKQLYILRNIGMPEDKDSISQMVQWAFEYKKELDLIISTKKNTLQQSTIAIAEVQKQLLRPGQTFLEYMVTDSSVFVFWANALDADLLEMSKSADLGKWVERLRHGITGFYSLPQNDPRRSEDQYYDHTLDDYLEASEWVYTNIFAPVEPFVGNNRDLLIVPDDALYLVPFCALLHKRPVNIADFGDYAFLGLDHTIGFAFSASLQMEMMQHLKTSRPLNNALVMAPFFTGDPTKLSKDPKQPTSNRKTVDPLPYSGIEAYTVIKSLCLGQALYGQQATLDAFLQQAPQSRILHLSTHAAADGRFGQYCFVMFAKKGAEYERLYVRDIYRLRLNADLVTLSACESALGALQPGEGLVGLTQSFAQVGAKSVLSTLWQVDDSSTADLMGPFYQHLAAKKMTKNQALAEAQRAFLNSTSTSNAAMHPFFWAAFTLIGDQSILK